MAHATVDKWWTPLHTSLQKGDQCKMTNPFDLPFYESSTVAAFSCRTHRSKAVVFLHNTNRFQTRPANSKRALVFSPLLSARHLDVIMSMPDEISSQHIKLIPLPRAFVPASNFFAKPTEGPRPDEDNFITDSLTVGFLALQERTVFRTPDSTGRRIPLRMRRMFHGASTTADPAAGGVSSYFDILCITCARHSFENYLSTVYPKCAVLLMSLIHNREIELEARRPYGPEPCPVAPQEPVSDADVHDLLQATQ